VTKGVRAADSGFFSEITVFTFLKAMASLLKIPFEQRSNALRAVDAASIVKGSGPQGKRAGWPRGRPRKNLASLMDVVRPIAVMIGLAL
jgi:hypothetical protein